MTPFVSYPSFQPSENMRKGYLFEQWVVKQFHAQGFTLLEWRSDKEVNGIYPLSSKKPDLVFELNSDSSKLFYAVECKWRKDLLSGFNLISKRKIQEYREFSDKMQTPVFVAIGVGGFPGNPEINYLVHLNALFETVSLSEEVLNKYSWPTNILLQNYISSKAIDIISNKS